MTFVEFRTSTQLKRWWTSESCSCDVFLTSISSFGYGRTGIIKFKFVCPIELRLFNGLKFHFKYPWIRDVSRSHRGNPSIGFGSSGSNAAPPFKFRYFICFKIRRPINHRSRGKRRTKNGYLLCKRIDEDVFFMFFYKFFRMSNRYRQSWIQHVIVLRHLHSF